MASCSNIVDFCLSLSPSPPSLSTKLERDDTENFRQREARASRIAQEIEAKDNKKRLGVDDVGTEEELYEPSSGILDSSLYFLSPILPLSLFLFLSLSCTDSVQ